VTITAKRRGQIGSCQIPEKYGEKARGNLCWYYVPFPRLNNVFTITRYDFRKIGLLCCSLLRKLENK
jgi:hypothetical protein